MKSHYWILFSASLLPVTSAMAQSVYCPQHSGYINPGMSESEVISACGQPLAKQTSNMPAVQKIPVTQLYYTALNTGSVYPGLNAAFYTQWSLPSGSTGITLQIDVVNNKVTDIKSNGSSTNAMSLCQGNSFQIGDNINKVYSACGMPSSVNNTFVNQPIASNAKPVIWVYQVNQYQSPMSLTFVSGKLQSINQ